MAGSSLLLLLDDIAALLDDVSVMTKVAAKKTAGVLGDDLALNAQQVAGVRPIRELPVVWAVAKGSMLNKVILVPAALAISAFAPWAVTPLMMIGGAYLCFEGVEKLAHRFLHDPAEDAHEQMERIDAVADPEVDLVAFERDKIKGAIRTDFILSAEIIVISLGIVADADFSRQLAVLSTIAVLMTVGVYGLVAGIVKLDDAGLHLSQRDGDGAAARAVRALGRGILVSAPWLMKFLSVAGTAAMFLVGGGILTHAIGPVHEAIAAIRPDGAAGVLVSMLADAAFGIAVGILVLLAVGLVRRVLGKGRTPAPEAPGPTADAAASRPSAETDRPGALRPPP
jgi:predicted DNA repair protein MutK